MIGNFFIKPIRYIALAAIAAVAVSACGHHANQTHGSASNSASQPAGLTVNN